MNVDFLGGLRDEQSQSAFYYECSQEVDCLVRTHRMSFSKACRQVGLNPKHYTASGLSIAYLPTPSEITQRCAVIQKTWSSSERRKRARFVTDNFSRCDGAAVETAARAAIDETLTRRRASAAA
jgi:hypothetical protein